MNFVLIYLIIVFILHLSLPKYAIIVWYDIWIGVYYDKIKRTIYVFPIPCIGFKIVLK